MITPPTQVCSSGLRLTNLWMTIPMLDHQKECHIS